MMNKNPAFLETRNLMALALPISVSLSAAMLIAVVDTIMISPLGTNSLAAVSLTSSFLIVLYAALFGLASICGVLAAQAYGRKENDKITTLIKAAILIGGLCGAGGTLLMFFAFFTLSFLGQPEEVLQIIDPYWISMSFLLIPYTIFYALKGVYEAIDQAWSGVVFSFSGVVFNIPANWILIHGMGEWEGLGLLGAGLASLFSQTAALILILIHWRMSKALSAYRLPLKTRRQDIMRILKNGWPVALGYAGETGAFGVASLMIGWFGAVSLAANQIVTSIAMVLYMIPLGISAAVSVRVAQAVGANEQAKVKFIGYVAIVLAMSWMTFVMIMIILTGSWFSSLLAPDMKVAELATSLFIIVAIMQLGDGLQATSLGALRGVLDTSWPVLITLVIFWCVSLPAAYVLSVPFNMGAFGVWAGYASGLFIAGSLLTYRFSKKQII